MNGNKASVIIQGWIVSHHSEVKQMIESRLGVQGSFVGKDDDRLKFGVQAFKPWVADDFRALADLLDEIDGEKNERP